MVPKQQKHDLFIPGETESTPGYLQLGHFHKVTGHLMTSIYLD